METVTWGWFPPLFEERQKGVIKLFFYTQEITESYESVDEETGEVVIETRKCWKCDTVDLVDEKLYTLIQKEPDSLECQKRLLKERILAYDTSPHVNSFTIGGVSTWIDKATRVGLKLRFDAEKRLGKTETTLWQNGMQFPLPLVGDITALDMLDGIELYASACYDTTQMHLAQAERLKTVEELKAYDYTKGYPQKLVF